MSGPDWIKTSDLQWLHQFREHFPVYSAPTPQFGETFIDTFSRSLRYSIPTSYNGWFRSTVLLAIHQTRFHCATSLIWFQSSTVKFKDAFCLISLETFQVRISLETFQVYW